MLNAALSPLTFARLMVWREAGQWLGKWEGESDLCRLSGALLSKLGVGKYWGETFAVGKVDLQIVNYEYGADLYHCRLLASDGEDTVNLLWS